MLNILVVLLILMLLGLLPAWPYSASWGYAPSSTLAVVLLVIFVVLMLRGDRKLPPP